MARKRPAPYVPLSVYYADDEAIMEAGEDAELMYVRMLAYAGRTPTTEGYVPRRVCLSRLGIAERPELGPETSPESRLERLTDTGLIAVEGEGYRLVAWLKWNRSVEEMNREREQDRTRKVPLTRRAPEVSPERVPETGPELAPEHSGFPSGSTEAEEKRTEETKDLPALVPRAAATPRGHRLPDGWMPSPELVTQMQQECPQVDLEMEHRKFTDYWHDKAGKEATKVNWDGTWRNWMRNARPSAQRQQDRRQQHTDDIFSRAQQWAIDQDRKALSA